MVTILYTLYYTDYGHRNNPFFTLTQWLWTGRRINESTTRSEFFV